MRDMTRYMGWLRLVGSLQIYVSFAKEPYKRDYILQSYLQDQVGFADFFSLKDEVKNWSPLSPNKQPQIEKIRKQTTGGE